MSRGHVQGFDSNAEQFARLGNPWVGEPVLRKAAGKRGRKYPAPGRPGLPRRPERDSRTDCEAFERAKDAQRIALLVQAFKGNSRTVVTPQEPKLPTLAILPARSTELRLSPTERYAVSAWQRFNASAKRHAAEAAWKASEAGKAEARRQLARRIARLEEQLASMD